MLFTEKLTARTRAVDSMLCVGLDPDFKRIPEHLKNDEDPVWSFCRAIVDAVAPFVCAFKPQIAYFAAMGAEKTLERVIAYIREKHPDIPVILDAKRGDIGSTARMYAREAFKRYQADAVTVSPYMGYDTIVPYLEYPDKGVIILCRTSNPGGADIEELVCDGETIYERIARLAAGPRTDRSGRRRHAARRNRQRAQNRPVAAAACARHRRPGRRRQRCGCRGA